MNVLAFSPLHNSPSMKDDSGAFELEADAFCGFYFNEAEHVQIDNKQPHKDRGNEVLYHLSHEHSGALDAVAFFGHGVSNGMPSFGFDLREGRRGEGAVVLGCALARVLKPGAPILLYCCLTAKTADGFACALAKASGHPVFGHSTSGHTTKNPNKWKCTATGEATIRQSCIPNGMTKKQFKDELGASQKYRLSCWGHCL